MRAIGTLSLAIALCLSSQVAVQAQKGGAGGPAAGPAVAVRIGQDAPIYERVSTSDAVVIGKVTGMEKDPVDARANPEAPQKTKYTVASLKIEKALVGAKGLTDLRVGFIKQAAIAPPLPIRGRGGVRPQAAQAARGAPAPQAGTAPIRRPPFFQPTLSVGQEGLLFLNKHFEGDFYVIAGFQGFINKEAKAGFDQEVTRAERCVKLLENPRAGLKANDAKERLLTAALLISRYRTAKPGTERHSRLESIDADESKLILAALAEAEWLKNDSEMGIRPWMLFTKLGLTAKDEWTPPNRPQNYLQELTDSGKAWVAKHKDSYRIQRFVVDKK
jgi:hypothetical protein